MFKTFLLLFFISLTNTYALEIDACIDGQDVTTIIDSRETPYYYCARNTDHYIEMNKNYSGLYFLKGTKHPIAYTQIASNHTYLNIVDGAKRDSASICFMFEQIRSEGYDLIKLTSNNHSIKVLIGGSEYNSFFYDKNNSQGTASIDMNNTDYCKMKNEIINYLNSL